MKDKTFLKECLADALLDLISTKSYDSISILDITKKANISRATYYRHFTNKDELILYKMNLIFMSWKEQIQKEHIQDAKSQAILFFTFVKQQQKLVVALREANLYYLLQKFFLENILIDEPSVYEEYKNTGVSFFIIGLINIWIDHDFKETPEQLFSMMQHIAKEIYEN